MLALVLLLFDSHLGCISLNPCAPFGYYSLVIGRTSIVLQSVPAFTLLPLLSPCLFGLMSGSFPGGLFVFADGIWSLGAVCNVVGRFEAVLRAWSCCQTGGVCRWCKMN